MQKIRIFLFSFDDDVLLPLESCSTGIYIYIYMKIGFVVMSLMHMNITARKLNLAQIL